MELEHLELYGVEDVEWNPEAVWAASPLSRDAIARIIAAAQMPVHVAEPEREALHLTFARLGELVCGWLLMPPVKAAELRAVDSALQALDAAMRVVSLCIDAPPPIPTDWEWAMVDWIKERKADTTDPRTKSFERLAYPHLVALFHITFGTPPGDTLNGPATRFLRSFLEEVSATLASTQLERPGGQVGPWPKLPIPSPENFRAKIRAYKAASADEHSPARLLFSGFCASADWDGSQIDPEEDVNT